MKLLYINNKIITKIQLRRIYNWYNNPKTSKYLRNKSRTMTKIIEILSRRKSKSYMINVDNKDIGYIFITKAKNLSYLTIIVDQKYWGKGYGKKAMLLIENEVKKWKINKIVLGLCKENKRAYNLYKKLGYKINKKICINNIIAMEKLLN